MNITAKALASQASIIADHTGMDADAMFGDPGIVPPEFHRAVEFRSVRTDDAATWPNDYRARVVRRVRAETETERARINWILTLAADLGVIHRIGEITK